ncbi:hypothetical protein BKA62DRAFT_778314 [Auriculariales sp. MPI-PUGE-AT-0066]|nr:hypothetical protein BKA62DRAFT_778314 [Auriculariales sp. MPI-PUGE-AT-0066]
MADPLHPPHPEQIRDHWLRHHLGRASSTWLVDQQWWSDFDVSAMCHRTQARRSRACASVIQPPATRAARSTITSNMGRVDNAYTVAETDIGGIGGNLGPGSVRIEVVIEFNSI